MNDSECLEVQDSWKVTFEIQPRSLEKKKKKCYIFFELEQWMRQEEMEEKYNKEVKQGWRFASDAAVIGDENAGSEDRKHTSSGVFVANDSGVGAGVDRRRSRYVDYWKRGGIAQAWRNVRGMDIEE